MKLRHLIHLQLFARDNNISLFTEAIKSIMDIINYMVDEENDTRRSIGGYSAIMMPYASMDAVGYFLESYVPRYMEEAIQCVVTLTSMPEKEAEQHVYHLIATGRSPKSIIDEAYKIMAL